MIFHAIHLEKDQISLWKWQTLLMDVVPKLLLGKFWILNSYQETIRLWPQILKSRQQLSDLLHIQNRSRTLQDIEEEILKMLPETLELQRI